MRFTKKFRNILKGLVLSIAILGSFFYVRTQHEVVEAFDSHYPTNQMIEIETTLKTPCYSSGYNSGSIHYIP